MKLREMVQEKIRNYIENYDIEDLIRDSFYEADVDEIIEVELEYAICHKIDLKSIIEEAVKAIVEDEIEDVLEDFRQEFIETVRQEV